MTLSIARPKHRLLLAIVTVLRAFHICCTPWICEAAANQSSPKRVQELTEPEQIGRSFDRYRFFGENSVLLRDAWNECGVKEDRLVDGTRKIASSMACLNFRLKQALEFEPGSIAFIQLWSSITPGACGIDLFNITCQEKTVFSYTRLAESVPDIPTQGQCGVPRSRVIVGNETDGTVHTIPGQLLMDGVVDALMRPSAWELLSDLYDGSGTKGQNVLAEDLDILLVPLDVNLAIVEPEATTKPCICFKFLDEGILNFTFSPGIAVLHRGLVGQVAYPVAPNSVRHNMVAWLFGKVGYVQFFPQATCRAALLSPTHSVLSNDEAKHHSSLHKARKLIAPSAKTTSGGESEGYLFWEENSDLLRQAWVEWEQEQQQPHGNGVAGISPFFKCMTPFLKRWLVFSTGNRSREENKRPEDVWNPIAPGIYVLDLFNSSCLEESLVLHLHESLSQSGIPTRRPNGMNRYGIIIDNATDGAVHSTYAQAFVDDLVHVLLRPSARALFPEYYDADEEDMDDIDGDSYAFTIRYKKGQDVSLKEHSDASFVTMNINLGFSTSDTNSEQDPHIYFRFRDDDLPFNFTFSSGSAVLHRGLIRHGAYPIAANSERHNMVVWLFGDGGYVRALPVSKKKNRLILDLKHPPSMQPFGE